MRPLVELIRSEIVANGVLPFARFMELALYCPDYGYYQTNKDNPGRRGDFYTSVSTGELFGQLLAFQFAQWLEPEVRSQRSEVRIVEAGAHDGTLAKDILTWLQLGRPELFGRIQYCIIEPSARRQAWQTEKLGKFAPQVRWASGFPELMGRDSVEPMQPPTPQPRLHGVIFSNELLDALPVHRFGWDASAKEWFEWGVALDGEKFIWAKVRKPEVGSQKSGPRLPSVFGHLPSDLLGVLPDGYTIEISPAAERWWQEAAGILEQGRLMTIDYGLGADELFSPSRPHGTLRAYFRHHLADDILANPGEQDITAHVNFSAIQATGESVGLTSGSFLTQAQFLTRVLDQAVKDRSFGEWDVSRTRQFQTLTHPEHLGRVFRVLVQSR
ncbi:MAG TPA: SAM-dependent methyltransferase [Verrucomicrobiae bacterium]|nr:SAM-dependent methyltransferase [Verrucomicrobiae bacterium]